MGENGHVSSKSTLFLVENVIFFAEMTIFKSISIRNIFAKMLILGKQTVGKILAKPIRNDVITSDSDVIAELRVYSSDSFQMSFHGNMPLFLIAPEKKGF